MGMLRGSLLWRRCVDVGERHRQRALVRRYDKVQERYSRYSLGNFLDASVHARNIAGVGMPLFYNFLIFLFILGALVFSCFSVVWIKRDPQDLFHSHIGVEAGLALLGHRTVCGAGALVRTALSSEELRSAFRVDFALCLVTLLLLVVGLLVNARVQMRVAEIYDEKTTSWCDFAIKVEGLPPHATSEAELVKFFENEFQGLLHHGVLGVSIAYDFSSVKDDVDAIMDHHVSSWDVRLGTYDRTLAPPVPDIPKLLSAWFLPGHPARLQCSGRAWLVLRHQQDVQAVMEHVEGRGPERPRRRSMRADQPGLALRVWNRACQISRRRVRAMKALMTAVVNPAAAQPLLRVDFKGNNLTLQRVMDEPTNIAWENLDRSSKASRRIRRIKCVLGTILVLWVLDLLILIPFSTYQLLYTSAAGTSPSSRVYLLLGLANGLCGTFWIQGIYQGLAKAKFSTRGEEDSFLVFFIYAMFFANTLVTFVMTVTTEVVIDDAWHRLIHLNDPSAITTQHSLCERWFKFIFPGCVVGAMRGVTTNKIIGSFNPLADITRMEAQGCLNARSAEKRLEADSMSYCWDYGNVAVQVSTVILGLVFWSPRTPDLLLCALLFWSMIYYWSHKFQDLFESTQTYLTDVRLNWYVNHLFSIPVGLLAGVVALWAVRAFQWGTWVIPVFMALTVTVYVVTLREWAPIDVQKVYSVDFPTEQVTTRGSESLHSLLERGDGDNFNFYLIHRAKFDKTDGEEVTLARGSRLIRYTINGARHDVAASTALGDLRAAEALEWEPVDPACCSYAERFLPYSWLNTNPIWVLKRNYLNQVPGAEELYERDCKGTDAVRLYAPGKQYLQVSSDLPPMQRCRDASGFKGAIRGLLQWIHGVVEVAKGAADV
mmetsp:Transcript_30069/g.77432  ORF Transcript_30069/g.77432 Transcript_30069/m.77432 type:complete len:884 (+) Transcript_30069:2-2653(+)